MPVDLDKKLSFDHTDLADNPYLIFLGGVIFVLLLPSKCVAFEVGYKENRRPRARFIRNDP